MTKRMFMNIILIAICVFILVGAGLTGYLLNVDKSVIKVSVIPNEPQAVTFEQLSLVPGESCEYTLLLSSEYAEKYQLILKSEDQNLSHTLKNYACVRMEKEGQVLCDELLASALVSEDMVLTVDFSDREKNEIKIIYYMPEDVGNEAQNAEADFKLLITAQNQ